MELLTLIEIVSVIFNLLYVILLMRENIWCWICGIIGSALGIFLMIHANLYSEAILYTFYVVVGIYGWWVWKTKGKTSDFVIIKWPIKPHLMAIAIGWSAAVLLALFFSQQTDADYPWVDAHTTVFSFVASYMQAHKVLSSWLFWIIINGITIWLYGMKGLNFYSAQMIIYFGLSVWGYFDWRRKIKIQSTTS